MTAVPQKIHLALLCLCLGWLVEAGITVPQVHAAQQAWAAGLIEIGALYTNGSDYTTAATRFVDRMYAYDLGKVLFKPTLAFETASYEHHEFRLSRESAISYMIGGNSEYPEDHGFALKPWTAIRFWNADISLQGDFATAMGAYYFTDTKGTETKVEYTKGYMVDPQSKELRLWLQHSSLPYQPPQPPVPSSFFRLQPAGDVDLRQLLILVACLLFFAGTSTRWWKRVDGAEFEFKRCVS